MRECVWVCAIDKGQLRLEFCQICINFHQKTASKSRFCCTNNKKQHFPATISTHIARRFLEPPVNFRTSYCLQSKELDSLFHLHQFWASVDREKRFWSWGKKGQVKTSLTRRKTSREFFQLRGLGGCKGERAFGWLTGETRHACLGFFLKPPRFYANVWVWVCSVWVWVCECARSIEKTILINFELSGRMSQWSF